MDYSYAYAKRRGLIGGNPTIRYKLSDEGKYVPAKELCVGCRVRIIGIDGYMIGKPCGLHKTGTIFAEEDWRLRDIKLEYKDKKCWRVSLDGSFCATYDWVYWEHDLEPI